MDNNAGNVSLLEIPALAELIASAPVVKRATGETLFKVGEPCASLPVIESGNATIYNRINTGQQITLYQLKAGAICPISLSSLLQHSTYPATAVADIDVQVRYLAGEKLQATISGSPEIFRIFLDTFVGCLYNSACNFYRIKTMREAS